MTAIAMNDLDRRDEVVRLGLWMFLATVTMLFAAFTSAYVVRKSGSDWHHLDLPAILWVNTGLLAASSAAVEFAYARGGKGRFVASGVAFGAAIALGSGFLAGQIVAWRHLMAAGVYLPTNPSSSFFYMMTGAHAVHIVAALAVLLWGALRTWSGRGASDPRRWATTMSVCRTFWHYLGGVWIYLFIVMTVL